MKTHTSDFKNEIKNFGRQINSKIIYTIGNEEIELGPEQLNSITPHYESKLLKSVMKQLDIDSNVDIPLGTLINYQFGLKVGNSYEYVNFGNYIVYSSEKQEDTESYKIICYDKMLNSMTPYVDMSITYPITIRDYLSAICDELNLDFKNENDNFVNYNRVIEKELFLDEDGNSLDYTFRDVLDQLAEVTASIICINEEDDELEIRYVDNEQNEELLNISENVYSGYGINSIIKDNNMSVGGTATSNQQLWITDFASYNIPELPKGQYKFSISDDFTGGTLTATFVGLDGNFVGTYDLTYPYVICNINKPFYKCWIKITITKDTTYDNQIKLSFKSNEQRTYDTIDEEYFKNINVKFGEKFGPVNSIVLTRAGGSDSVYLQDDESVTQNGLCEIKIEDNQIMNFNDRSDYLLDILSKLNGIEYYINDYSSTGIVYYNVGDRYNVSIDNNIYKCIMFNDEINVTQGLEETVHTDMPKETNTDYTKADKTDRRVNQTYIIADKQKGEIQALISQTSTLEDEVGNMYSKDDIDNLIIDAKTGFTNTFSKTGGNNIFRNTGLWFTTNDTNNPYEFWSGNATRVKEENATIMYAICLQNGTFEQEVQELKNAEYTISFKYIKTELLANVKVVINDVEYILNAENITDINEFNQTIQVTSNYINVKFISDMSNSCRIFDLMVNIGDAPLVYSQNENETTTDTVNISKGITITSSDNINVKFKADFDGIRTIDNTTNQPITEFTDTGMTTKEAIIQSKSNIVGLLYQEVENLDQTWITRL